MATLTQQPKLAHDSFLESYLTEVLGHKPDAPRLENAREHIDRFRKSDWKAIKLELNERFGIDVKVEPHWVAPGKAVYWHRTSSVSRDWNDEATEVVTSVELADWEPSGALPARNASNIATYIQKGFALRPPSSDVEVDVEDDEAAKLLLAQGELYACTRHGRGKTFAYASWTAYLRHCQFYREVPNIDPPPQTVARAKTYRYFCYLHDIGWNNARLATQHIRAELSRPGRSVHPQLREMDTKPAQGAKKD